MPSQNHSQRKELLKAFVMTPDLRSGTIYKGFFYCINLLPSMSIELPYYRFYPGKWINGDISLEDYTTQGVFKAACCFYWSKSCEVSIDVMRKKFRGNEENLEALFSADIIKVDGEMCVIDYLDEQWSLLAEKSIKNRENGRKGGQTKKAIAEAKPKRTLKPINNTITINNNSLEPDKSGQLTLIDEPVLKFDELLKYFIEKTGRKFKKIHPKTQNQYLQRLKDGYTKEDIAAALNNAMKDSYHIESGYRHLTPDFFSRADKLEKWATSASTKIQPSGNQTGIDKSKPHTR